MKITCGCNSNHMIESKFNQRDVRVNYKRKEMDHTFDIEPFDDVSYILPSQKIIRKELRCKKANARIRILLHFVAGTCI